MKLGILPVPPTTSPIAVLLFVQLYTVPATAPLKVIAAVEVLLHTVWFATGFTVGVGLTVIVAVVDGPVQVVAVREGGVKRAPLLPADQETPFLPGVVVAKVPALFSTPWVLVWLFAVTFVVCISTKLLLSYKMICTVTSGLDPAKKGILV